MILSILLPPRYKKLRMKETRFIDQRKAHWTELEEALASGSKDPDQLSDLFVQVTDDLSYARTFYGNRVVRVYLNQLTQRLFRTLFRNTAQHGKKLRTFIGSELPASIYLSRKSLLTALVVFVFSMAIGVFSSRHNPEFPRSILGDSYVNMTDRNIENGDPMAVYKDSDVLNMFIRIATNNLLVAFRAFIFGLLFALGSLGILIYNGIMVGAFQYYFISKGLALDSILTIWMHGTMEISAIVISGGAGLIMGSGLVFPGTYTRLQSLRMSARAGIRIMAAVTPIIIAAALIEAVVTRYTDLGDGIRAVLIVLQAMFIVFYFVLLPWRLRKKANTIRLNEDSLPMPKPIESELKELQFAKDIFSASFRLYFYSLPGLLKKLSLPSIMLLSFFLIQQDDEIRNLLSNQGPFFFEKLGVILNIQNHPYNVLIISAFIAWVVTECSMIWRMNPIFIPEWAEQKPTSSKRKAMLYGGNFLIVGTAVFIGAFTGDFSSFYCVLSTIFFFPLIAYWNLNNHSFMDGFGKFLHLFIGSPSVYLYTFISFVFPAIMMLVLADMFLPLVNFEVLEWNFRFGEESYIWIKATLAIFTSIVGGLLVIIMMFFAMVMANYSAIERTSALGLRMRLKKFNLISQEE